MSATASSIPRKRPGSWRSSAASQARADAGSPRPRRTSTWPIAELTPSSRSSASTCSVGQGGISNFTGRA